MKAAMRTNNTIDLTPVQTIMYAPEPFIEVMGGLEITVMALVCKSIRNMIIRQFKDKICARAEVCDDVNISPELFDYMIDVGCNVSDERLKQFNRYDFYNRRQAERGIKLDPYIYAHSEAAARYGDMDYLRLKEYDFQGFTENSYHYMCRTNKPKELKSDLIACAIRGNQYDMMMHLLVKKHDLKPEHVGIALIHSIKCFEYLVRDGNKYIETAPDVETIVGTNNSCALKLLHKYKISLDNFIKYAVDNLYYPALDSLAEIDEPMVREYAAECDNIIAYKYLHNLKKTTYYVNIQSAVNNESVLVVEFIYSVNLNLQSDIINMAIKKDLIKLMGSFICSDSLITDEMYSSALRRKSIKILGLLGFRESMVLHIINTNDLQILDLFPAAASVKMMDYAISMNYKIAVKWMIDRGIKFTKANNTLAWLLEHHEIAAYYVESK